MTINEGDTLPQTTFVTMSENGPQPVDHDAFFAGRKVALFFLKT